MTASFHLLILISIILTASSCPDISSINPCSCTPTIKRRSSAGFQNQYHVSCNNVTYEELKAIFYNISQTQARDEVFDHFSGSELFKSDGRISDDFFSGLKIKSVSITNSNIVSFGPKAFRGVTDSLDLSNNKIENLPTQLNLMIRKVNLSNNQIREIGQNSFASQTIDLSHNQISLIREGAFKAQTILNVNLEGNKLESNSFQAGFVKTFTPKGYDETSINLFFNQNHLTHLEYDVFHPLLSSPHTTISLAQNPITCDCRVKWVLDLKRYDSAWTTLYPRIDNARCSDGSDLIKDYYNPEINSCGNTKELEFLHAFLPFDGVIDSN